MIASTLLDQLIGALRHHERRTADAYRLVRPTFRRLVDADRWLDRQTGSTWGHDATRSYMLGCWIRLRRRHHVAWLERGGAS